MPLLVWRVDLLGEILEFSLRRTLFAKRAHPASPQETLYERENRRHAEGTKVRGNVLDVSIQTGFGYSSSAKNPRSNAGDI